MNKKLILTASISVLATISMACPPVLKLPSCPSLPVIHLPVCPTLPVIHLPVCPTPIIHLPSCPSLPSCGGHNNPGCPGKHGGNPCPEPASMATLLIGGVAALRKRMAK
jgi:hypothetical protein